MIQLNTQSLKISKELLEEKYSSQYIKAIHNIKHDISDKKIGFLDVYETIDVKKIEKFVEKKLQENIYENIVVLGLGGSALGTLAIHQALKGKNWNLLSYKQRKTYLRLFVVDNVDPRKIRDTLDVIDLEKTLFVVISKSGNTVETKSLFTFFQNEVKKNTSLLTSSCEGGGNEKLSNQFIIVAGENSDFGRKYKQKGYNVFSLADNIGGRFSVLTAVGLLPLAFCGVNIGKLLEGVKKSKKIFLSKNIDKNIALHTALIHHYSYREAGKNIQVFFPYIDSFSYFGEWYKQLVGESLGKGGMGATTTTAVGVTDQHSQLQLYFDGPNDKILIFLELEDFGVDYPIDKYNFSDLMKYEKFGTQESINKYNKLNYTLKIQELDEETLAELIIMLEMQTAIIGELSGINPYNQPGVEIGKRITKMKLKEKFGKSVVTIGGGNGHSNMLLGIKNSFIDSIDLKAIVSMSDDGRTTGKLMQAFKNDLNIDFPPPGDVRRCLYFLSNSRYKKNIEKYFETIFSVKILIKDINIGEMFNIIGIKGGLLHEFISVGGRDFLDYTLPMHSSIEGYKLGNIIMGVLYYNYKLDYNKVMDFMHILLKVEAQVIPVTTDRALIEVVLQNGDIIETQDAISNRADYNSRISEVQLMKCSKNALHNVDIESSLTDADYIIISAGDLFTSTISNLIIGNMKNIIQKSPAKIIFIGNTTNKGGETQNFKLIEFVIELEKYLGKSIDYFIVNNQKIELSPEELRKFKDNISVKGGEYIYLSEDDKKILEKNKIKIVEAALLDRESLYKHDAKKLAHVLKKIIV